MILLLSTNGDTSTSDVIDWLRHYKAKWIRLNDNDLFDTTSLDLQINNQQQHVHLHIRNSELDLSHVTVCWYRKYHFYAFSPFARRLQNLISTGFDAYFRSEYNGLLKTIISFLKLKSIRWLANPHSAQATKLEMLFAAKEVGLSIPDTVISNRKNVILSFLGKCREIITKPIVNVAMISHGKKFYNISTAEIDHTVLRDTKAKMFPSLVQKKIEKAYELRIFFLEGICYAMAIFSQLDPQTQLDFRLYNYERPNRVVPYILPVEIDTKIKRLMQKLALNTGSIDLIRCVNGEYIFLEVNPLGQFGMVSHPCNYNLEEKVASWLIKQTT